MNTHYQVKGKALALANAFGFLFPGELFLIQALVQSLPEDATVVQLGAGVGTASLGMVEMRPSVHAFTVDISTGGPFGGLENERNAFKDTGLKLPKQILGDSQKVWAKWADGPIDLLFIDADHDLPGVRIDTEKWTPLIKVGGYALFHDYSSNNWPKVAATVDELMIAPEWERVILVDTIIAFRRLANGIEEPKIRRAYKGRK